MVLPTQLSQVVDPGLVGPVVAMEGGGGPEDAGNHKVENEVAWRCAAGARQLQRKTRQRRVQQKKGAAKNGVPAGTGTLVTIGVPEEGGGQSPEADETAQEVKAVPVPARTARATTAAAVAHHAQGDRVEDKRGSEGAD